jgi:histidinol-phosphatase
VDLDLSLELEFALSLADVADTITLPHYDRRSFTLDWKSNQTEVTEADRDAEAAIASLVATHRGAHALFGEEHGHAGDQDSDWRWVIDPIDGTSNFVRGVPVWATLVALTHVERGPVVGVVSAPAMARRWWAADGLGAYADGRRIQVSAVGSLAEAQVSVTFNTGWDDLGLTPNLVGLQQAAYRARGYGDFWQHMLVAEGAVDVAIDAIGLAPYDVAAVMAVVEQAGGRLTDRHGTRTFEEPSAISSNGILHDTVIAHLGT